MNRILPAWAGVFVCLAAQASAAASEPIETVEVVGERPSRLEDTAVTADRVHQGAADGARLFALMPGADVNDNGAISGQIQYRGMFGPRMEVRVNGMSIPAGGPNWMDPPMHYVPRGLLHSATLTRGIADVSHGGIGGVASAEWKHPDFSEDDVWRPAVDVDSSVRSVDDGHDVAATVGLSSRRHRIHLSGSDESAEDYSAGDGHVAGTAFERSAFGVGYGFQHQDHAVAIGYHRIETDNAGTPSLPLDIRYFDTDLWHARYSYDDGDRRLTVRAAGSGIDHVMDNFSLRPAPDFSSLPLPPFAGPDRRFVVADSSSREAGVIYGVPLADGRWESGIEWREEQHDATVHDPDFEPFFITNFTDTDLSRVAGFTRWTGSVADRTSLELGLRLTRATSRTDPVDAFPARLVDADPAMWPMGTPPRAVWLLRERFNAADRRVTDHLTDWVAGVTRELGEHWKGELTLARKSRAPVYQERYLWLPLEVNGGLGDGNNYVGDPTLDPEVSHQVEVGLEWAGRHGYVTPRAFYRRVNDYIQGVAVTDPVVTAVSANASGDPTPLMFANVDAELYGFDVAFGWRLGPALRLDGSAAYTRGKRRDVHDDLYRIAPPSLRLGLSWERGPLELTLEQELVARMDHPSAALTDDAANPNNRFASVDGYGLTHLYGVWRLRDGLRLDVGVENVFDRHYVDPTSGFNRNAAGSTPVGQRLPGRGRNVFARVWYRMP